MTTTVSPVLQPDGAYRGVGGRPRHGERASHAPGHTVRAHHQVFDLDHHDFGLAAPRVHEPEYLVTDDEPGDGGAHLVHDAGQIASLAGGKSPAIHGIEQALSNTGFAGVDPCGHDLDQDLARAGSRPGDLHHLEDVDIAVFVESDSLGHGSSFSRMTRGNNRARTAFIPSPPVQLMEGAGPWHGVTVWQSTFE